MPQQIFTSNGTFSVPAGVTEIVVEAWGAGGGGRANVGGGGGGAYSRSTLSVTPLDDHAVVVAQSQSGDIGNPGVESSFGGTLVVAKSGAIGNPSTGGQASAGTGDVKFSGGNGLISGGNAGAGGGAGTTENGGSAPGSGFGVGGVEDGGDGGDDGSPGSLIGGGGGSSGVTGATGARGEVRVTWDDPVQVSERDAEATGQDQDDDEREAEATGSAESVSDRSAQAEGAIIAEAERDAEAHGIDQESSDRNAEADGGIFVNDERAAQGSGTDSDTSDREAEATGAFISAETRAAEAHGVDTAEADREAEATGADSESSDRSAEAIAQAARIDSPVMRKSISIKAYTRSGTFIREIADADFSGFMKVINQGLGDCIITIGRKFDDIGADFVEGNHIEIWLTDKETVAMQFGPLRSRRIYAGEVKLVEPMIEGAQEQVQITLQGYGILLGLDVLKSSAQTSLYTRTTGGVGTTDTPQAVDIGSVVRGIIDRYIAETVNPRIGYTAASIPAVGENMTYTFEQRTYREAIEKCLAAAPFGHYWYLDENGLFTFRQIGITPTHKFVFGKHFSGVRVARSLEKVRNFMMIWNGLPTGGGGLYKKYENAASVLKYGRRVERLTDAGIGSEATMDLIGAKFLAESSEIEVKFIFTVMDNQGSDAFGYDIESINPGDTCTVFNFNSSISELLRENMIITEVEYTPQRARITIEPIRISIADISERLKKQISEQATQGIIESYS